MSALLRDLADNTRAEAAPRDGLARRRVDELRRIGTAIGPDVWAICPMDTWSVWRRESGGEWAVCIAEGLASLVDCRGVA